MTSPSSTGIFRVFLVGSRTDVKVISPISSQSMYLGSNMLIHFTYCNPKQIEFSYVSTSPVGASSLSEFNHPVDYFTASLMHQMSTITMRGCASYICYPPLSHPYQLILNKIIQVRYNYYEHETRHRRNCHHTKT